VIHTGEKIMHDKEAIDMMERCMGEITSLRREVDELRPKADAYDSIKQILGMMPSRSIGMGEDLVWRLKKRIEQTKDEMKRQDAQTNRGVDESLKSALDKELAIARENAKSPERPAQIHRDSF
jgi:hypothetical protein